MNREHTLPELMAMLSLVMVVAAAASPCDRFLWTTGGLFGLASAVGLDAVRRSRESRMIALLRRLSASLQRWCCR